VPLLIKQVCSPHGMIVISGPTGSGKTTFLHALLHHIPDGAAVETLEDPTEIIASYNKMISQTNLQPGEKYEDVMSSLMRKDPDILVYGEMRDSMVIDACANAALTGHLILTTFHTNNSIGVLQRMVDMGQSPKDLAQETVLNTIIATRLAPILCPKCKQPIRREDKYAQVFEHEELKSHIDHIYTIHEDGCEHCKFTGVEGVSPVVEIIVIDDEARKFIHEADFDGLKESLIARGWETLPQQAINKVIKGDLDPLDAHTIFGIFQSEEKSSFKYQDIY
jgi:type II secretory ATPase GspE/PulE/Tfp pilus assembly ATPase PilB-like protein